MTTLNAKSIVTKAINTLANFINEDKIDILGSIYTVTKVGRSTITVTGKRNAKYTIAVSYKATVRENNKLFVFSLFNASKETFFTVTPAGIIKLEQ